MTTYSRFLALDCSFSSTGWVWGDETKLEKSGIYRMSKDLRQSQNLNGFKRWLTELVTINKIEKIWFEEAIMPHAKGEINARGKVQIMQNTSLSAMTALIGCAVVVALVSDDCGIDAIPIKMQSWRSELGVPTLCPPSVRKHLKGADAGRKWVKSATMAKLRTMGHSPKSDDEGDAMGIFIAVQQRLAKRVNEPTLALFDDGIIP